MIVLAVADSAEVDALADSAAAVADSEAGDEN
jgi:hypothetical protein